MSLGCSPHDFFLEILVLSVTLNPIKLILGILMTFIAGYLSSRFFSGFFENTDGNSEATVLCGEASSISVEITRTVGSLGLPFS